jgi:hypothetical protein
MLELTLQVEVSSIWKRKEPLGAGALEMVVVVGVGAMYCCWC